MSDTCCTVILGVLSNILASRISEWSIQLLVVLPVSSFRTAERYWGGDAHLAGIEANGVFFAAVFEHQFQKLLEQLFLT